MLPSNKNGRNWLLTLALGLLLFLIYYAVSGRLNFSKIGMNPKDAGDITALSNSGSLQDASGAPAKSDSTRQSEFGQQHNSISESESKPDTAPRSDTEQQKPLNEAIADCARRIDAQIDQTKRLPFKVQNKLFPWLLNREDNSMGKLTSASQGLTFLKALAHAGYIHDRTFPRNDSAAIELLNRLSQSEPLNSAFLAYLAVLYEKTNDFEKMSSTLAQLRQTTYFNTYFMQVTEIIYDQVQIPTEFLEAVAMVGSLPIVNYTPLSSLIKKHKLASVAQQMVLANYSVPMCNDMVDCLILEYVIGVKALNNLGVQHQFPDPKTYIKEASERSHLFGRDLEEIITKECDARGLIPLVEKLKDYKSRIPTGPNLNFSLAQ